MKLSELEPQWLSENMFAFLCPHCSGIWLTCKNAVMEHKVQRDLAAAAGLEAGPPYMIVLSAKNTTWTWNTLNFEIMSVTPSIDASASGHWHGFITQGKIK